MEPLNLKVAVAATAKHSLQKHHFGDADAYIFYHWDKTGFTRIGREENPFKSESHDHGSDGKGQAIVNFLRERDVRVIVSQKFGSNLKKVNQYFVPVTATTDAIDEMLNQLAEKKEWVWNELYVGNPNFTLLEL